MGAPLTVLGARASMAALLLHLALSVPAFAGTGLATIKGHVTAPDGSALANVNVAVASPAGSYRATTDSKGDFTIAGVTPDTYAISWTLSGYETFTLDGITALPDNTVTESVRLVRHLATIGHTGTTTRRAALATTSAVVFAAPTDTFIVRGDEVKGLLTGTASGLGSYTAGTVLGATSNMPGITQDQFSDLIVRGSKTYDSIYEYDGIPFPQEIVSTPGGTTFGAPLTSIGVAQTLVQQAGFTSGADNAFGAVVNEIPISGSYPGHWSFSASTGLTAASKQFEYERTGATPDSRIRWALAARTGQQQLPIGSADGQPFTHFYTGVAGGMSLDYTAQSGYSLMGNVHVKVRSKGDLELLGMTGATYYDQYGQPYPGLTYGNANGLFTNYPDKGFSSFTNPYAPVTTPGRDGGNYSLQAIKYTISNAHSSGVAHYSRGQNYGYSNIVVGSDDTFPLGFNSYWGELKSSVFSLGLDVENTNPKHDIGWGFDARDTFFDLHQVEPILDDFTTSITRSLSQTAWLYDKWSMTPRFSVLASLRAQRAHEMRIRDGNAFNVGQVDPHAGLSYKFGAYGRYAVTANYDHISMLPLPFAIDRYDSIAPVPFRPVSMEHGNHFTYGLEGSGRTNFRLTYWAKLEKDRIDILPASLAVQGSSTSVSASPSSIGLPANIADYRAHGMDLQLVHGPLAFSGTYTREFGLDSSQYSLNQINTAQLAAKRLIPGSFFPDFSGTLSYKFSMGRRTTITPQLSYESGMPYGNGRKVWTTDANGKPVQVPNDNHVNPGYAYYFLQDPSQPFDAKTNPYVANLGTPEGDDPQTLRLAPRTFVSLHIEHELSKRAKLSLDATNLLNFTGPIQLISNPYAPGPPGYNGGDPKIAAWMAQQWSQNLGQYRGQYLPYILGNGIPTTDGYHPEFGPQFNYGTGPYVTAALPYRRQVQLTLTVTP